MSEITITAVASTRTRSRCGSGTPLAEVSGMDNAAARRATTSLPATTLASFPGAFAEGRLGIRAVREFSIRLAPKGGDIVAPPQVRGWHGCAGHAWRDR